MRTKSAGICGAMAALMLLLGCMGLHAAQNTIRSGHGYVGLRPLPRTAAMDHSHNHGGSWMGTPTFEEQKGNYPFVAEHLDVVKDWLDGDFKTRRMFFEHYWGLDERRDNLDPNKNHLIEKIRYWEERGGDHDGGGTLFLRR